MVQKMLTYYQTKGFRRFFRHLVSRVFGIEEMSYKRWNKIHRLSTKELKKQSETVFEVQPRFSVFFLASKSSKERREEMIQFIQKQTYQNWEICVDQPICQALQSAKGDFFVFLDPNGSLAPNALFECATYINRYSVPDMIYTDEDQIDVDGKKYSHPQFKSGFNLDLLRSVDYISHFFVVKREIYEKIGYPNDEWREAQGYDYALRCAEVSKKIIRVPLVLYHYKKTSGSRENEKVVLREHLGRCGLSADVKDNVDKVHRVYYHLFEEPMVSVIIPNKDHIEDLDRCIESLFHVSNYSNIEIIIIENNSLQKETYYYYRKIQEKYDNLKVLYWKEEKGFNYSAINNFGVQEAAGKYLLFLNNDTEVIAEDSIREMLSYAQRKDVGIVGARLYYPDETVQHAGVILGLGGVAGHAFKDEPKNDSGYCDRIVCVQDCSAVTAACMLMSKELFRNVKGFDMKLKVAFNDIDLCMKVRRMGLLVVYTPYAELYHYESKSRGLDDTEEKIKQYEKESRYFIKKWKKELEEGDPYYNPNLTLEKHDFSLKIY